VGPEADEQWLDVWALGVLLYKLCYYTTPFEEHGTLAIVNAKYTFPQFPVYSPRLQHLIGESRSHRTALTSPSCHACRTTAPATIGL
jgi:AP2-associated kinase